MRKPCQGRLNEDNHRLQRGIWQQKIPIFAGKIGREVLTSNDVLRSGLETFLENDRIARLEDVIVRNDYSTDGCFTSGEAFQFEERTDRRAFDRILERRRFAEHSELHTNLGSRLTFSMEKCGHGSTPVGCDALKGASGFKDTGREIVDDLSQDVLLVDELLDHETDVRGLRKERKDDGTSRTGKFCGRA